jgi:hypothetical protein
MIDLNTIMNDNNLNSITTRLNDLVPALKNIIQDISKTIKEPIAEEPRNILHEIDLILARALNRLEFQLIDLNSEVKSNVITPNRFSTVVDNYKP